jgi:nitroimidazol reductase NimA-like FMN-containing flavoprotein (pyridoxamine 5'-phosphate oxidase superfamily)
MTPDPPRPPLRRRDKGLATRAEQDAVLHGALVLRLAMALDGEPYLVPLSFGYDGARLYFHTAMEGRKLDFLARNPRVCFEAEAGVELLRHPERACSWSFAYDCVLGTGTVRELRGAAERRAALDQIMRHYGGEGAWDYAPATLERTRIWALEIEQLSGKRSRRKESAD